MEGLAPMEHGSEPLCRPLLPIGHLTVAEFDESEAGALGCNEIDREEWALDARGKLMNEWWCTAFASVSLAVEHEIPFLGVWE